MSYWLMSANPNMYNHEKAFTEQGFIDTKCTRSFANGDVIYLYCTKPFSRIRFQTVVVETDIEPYIDGYWIKQPSFKKGEKCMRLKLTKLIDAEKLGIDALRENGLGYLPQGPIHLEGPLLSYINIYFEGVEDGK